MITPSAALLKPFFTTKGFGKGAGLGFSQVYGFAKQSGGDVAVDRLVGRGTTFTHFLPQVDGIVAKAIAPDVRRADPLDE